MSRAPEACLFVCNICQHALTGEWRDTERIRDRGRGKTTGHVRCHDYAACMLRAAQAKRAEIAAAETKP